MPSTIRATLVNSPMPNQRMNSGTSAKEGMVRSICMGESRITSPRLDRPLINAATTPILTPITSPATARCSDTSRFFASSPERIIAHSVSPICEGAAMTREGSQPSCELSCQSSSIASGLMQRITQAGSRVFRAAARATATAGLSMISVADAERWEVVMGRPKSRLAGPS
ncbi:MAG: hypothetical protein ACRYF9_09340 [Janthinobacterium lividum]